MSIKHSSLVASQQWKLRAAFALVLVASAFMWFARPIAEFLRLSRYTPTLIGTFLGLATLVLASLAIRCPNCRLSLVWFALSKKSTGSWLDWLLDEDTCPRCGHKPDTKGASNAADE
jgi:DNA-directed RNA polymerase subunit RPC12/RpoP